MGTSELWRPVEKRPGDRVCDGCDGKPSEFQGELL
jgi:hypothetical protein